VSVFASVVAAESLGTLVLASVTRRRTVATVVALSVQVEAGDVLFVPVVRPPLAAGSALEVPLEPPAGPPSRPVAADRAAPRVARVSGRLAFDLDARETRTSWTGDLSGDTRRRFATPTTRLSFTAAGLPGGVTLRANLRAAYRYDELQSGPPPMSVRAYEIAAVRTFEAVPLEVMAGRFANPYESYSAYWDGLLVRVGRATGPGVGVLVGFEPTLHDEGFSSALPKLTGFLDYAARGSGWRYDTDVSVHFLRPVGAPDRSHLGWSQRIALGPFDISQRLRVDGGLDGRPWSIADLRLRTSLDIAGPLRLRAAYGRTRPTLYDFGESALPGSPPLAWPAREEAGIGVDLTGARASLSLDGARTHREGAGSGLTASGSAGLRLGGARLLLSGRRWARGADESLGISPALVFGTRGMEWRLGYRYYRAGAPTGIEPSHAVEAQVGFELARALHVTVRGERLWGASLDGMRVRLGIWRGF